MKPNIDMPGQRHNRRAVSAIQRRHGAEERKAAAQARRDARKAKRANGPNVIVLSKMPEPAIVNSRPRQTEGIYGVAYDDPDGAYVWGGNADLGGQYQIIIIGPLKGTEDDYRRALVAWLKKPMRLVSSASLTGSTPTVQEIIDRRGFLSIILAPAGEA